MDHPFMNQLTQPGTVLTSSRNGQPGQSTEDEYQRQLGEFNRSVTIVIWYKANTDPIRLHQLVPHFPCFQISAFPQVANDLGLSQNTYLDTYVPTSNQWEQHTINSVRVVESQQRLLYRIRRSLIDGLSDVECKSLREELELQRHTSTRTVSAATTPILTTTISSATKSPIQSNVKPNLKRSAPSSADLHDQTSSKIHVSNGYYLERSSNNAMASLSSPVAPGPPTSDLSSSANSLNGVAAQSAHAHGHNHSQDDNVYMYQNAGVDGVYYSNGTNGASASNGSTNTSTHQQQAAAHSAQQHSAQQQAQQQQQQHSAQQQQQQQQDPSGVQGLPHYLLAPPAPAPPIPYHPHPPLKRWPNDYTVSELSTGFHAMDLLIAHAAQGGGMTQRQAFERVFGSRYVKSTVCRHRAVWRKAHQSLREQFEAMGTDERACWGEFVRRVEGRPPGKGGSVGGGGMSGVGGGGGGVDGLMSPSPSSATLSGGVYHDSQSGGEDEDGVHGGPSDGVLGGMQGQGGGGMQGNGIVYEHQRNHMTNGSHNVNG